MRSWLEAGMGSPRRVMTPVFISYWRNLRKSLLHPSGCRSRNSFGCSESCMSAKAYHQSWQWMENGQANIMSYWCLKREKETTMG